MGSLGIRTGAGTDKASFGNQVDFAGDTLASINTVKYAVYTTGENRAISVGNLPNVSFEVDPNGPTNTASPNFSTLNFVPVDAAANAWTTIDASTAKQWYLTGAAGTATGCNQTTYCTLAEVKTALPDATIFTAQIGKGRDNVFSGAVDGLQINGDVFDFEPTGVVTTTP